MLQTIYTKTNSFHSSLFYSHGSSPYADSFFATSAITSNTKQKILVELRESYFHGFGGRYEKNGRVVRVSVFWQ